MFSLDDELEFLLESLPTAEFLTFKSQRDMQDFNERDFDRRLAIIQVKALVAIASALKERNLDTRVSFS